jgi:hypothetical protein
MLVSLAMAAIIAAGPTAHAPEVRMVEKVTVQDVMLPYRGKYWREKQKKYTMCVLRRESNGNWFSTNRGNGYFGGFQFSKPLTRGATWMMLPELQHMFGKKNAKALFTELQHIEMHQWSPFYQHMAFATVLNWGHDWRGKFHWKGGRSVC